MLTEEQFSYLAKKYMDTVFRLAFHYTKSRSESDDITQEVLLRLYRTDTLFESAARTRRLRAKTTSGTGLSVSRSTSASGHSSLHGREQSRSRTTPSSLRSKRRSTASSFML